MQSGKLCLKTLALLGVTAAILLSVAACGAAEEPSAPQQPAQPAAAAPAQPAVAGAQGAPVAPQQPAQPAAAMPAATAAKNPRRFRVSSIEFIGWPSSQRQGSGGSLRPSCHGSQSYSTNQCELRTPVVKAAVLGVREEAWQPRSLAYNPMIGPGYCATTGSAVRSIKLSARACAIRIRSNGSL